MMEFLKTVRRLATGLAGKVIPYPIRLRADAETFGIVKFIEFAAKQVKPTDRVLDAGAGSCPYKKYFSHASYESTDFEEIFQKSYKGVHTFLCSLDDIPKPDDSYDAIINTQVLMHVEEPQKVLDEFHRILKPGGKLFLTAPQGWGVISAPYHFFNFTEFGLRSLFRKADFHVDFVRPRGGMFWYLGNRIRKLPSYILNQYVFDFSGGRTKLRPRPLALLLLPLYVAAYPVCEVLIPLLFFYLDRLDKEKSFTLGYACCCTKVK